MAIGGAIAAILAGMAAGASEGVVKRRQKEDEITRQIMQKSAFERASKGDTGFADNPEMSKVLGKQGVQALLSFAEQIQKQNAQTEYSDMQARTQMFGTDPLGGMAIGKHGGTMAGTGGGPTITGGPGGAVSVQQPGTGQVIPSLAPPSPEAALAQSVTGPAAGPADEAPSGEPVPLPPMGPAAAIPPQGAPTAPPSAPPTPQTGLERIQGGLKPGQSVSGKVGGMNFSVSGRDPGEKADEIGRRIIAQGMKDGKRPDEITIDVFTNGGKLPENFDRVSEAHFMKGVRARIKDIGTDIKSMSLQQKLAITEEALYGGGRAPDAWKSMVGLTKDDEHRIAAEVTMRAMDEGGLPFVHARKYAESRGLRLSNEDETLLGTRAYDKAKADLTQTLGHVRTPEQIMAMAALSVGGESKFVPPEDRKAVLEELAMAPETKQEMVERGDRIPRKGDIQAPGGATPGATVKSAREAVEARGTTLAGQRAASVKGGQATIPDAAHAGAQEAAITNEQTTQLIARIEKGYAGLASNFGGPFGLRGRLTAAKAKMNRTDSQAAADLQSSVDSLRAQLGHAMAGAAIGPAEKELYFRVFPDLHKDSDVEFKAHLKVTKQNIADLRAARSAIGQEQNLRPTAPGAATPSTAAPSPIANPEAFLDQFRGPAPAAPAPATPPAALPGQPGYPGYNGPGLTRLPDTPTTPPRPGMVWVKSPTGEWGQWDAAKPIPQGFRR